MMWNAKAEMNDLERLAVWIVLAVYVPGKSFRVRACFRALASMSVDINNSSKVRTSSTRI